MVLSLFVLQGAEAPTPEEEIGAFYGVSQGCWLTQDNATYDLGSAREGPTGCVWRQLS